jgi:prepilin-type processing-associated H-X9-DG protein
MEQDLLGYLLDGLDAADARQVEEALEASPALRLELVRFRKILQPLEADAESGDPPPDLYLRTLRMIAHAQTQKPARTVKTPVERSEGRPARSWWRRADVLVAASVLFIAGMLLPNLVLHLRRQAAITACRDNLRLHHSAISQYQTVHAGAFPKFEPEGRLNAAGAAEVKLRDGGFWNEGMRINCPGHGEARGLLPPTLAEIETLAQAATNESWKQRLSGCYAFPLGYWKGTGPNQNWEQVDQSLGGRIPIMADRPPRPDEFTGWEKANSPNHNFSGQNVLFQDGHVEFLTKRRLPVGPEVDEDLYRNRHGKLAPGAGPYDAVLVPSEVGVPPKPRPTAAPPAERK